jgi:tRNA threonylcarbamoyl adenosine modification protein YeaZ
MILFIDTSQDKTIIALGKDERIISRKIWQTRYQQSETLLPAINQLLKKNRFSLKNLTSLIVNSGPGSYTGLRVGIATANALSFGLKIPLIEIKNIQKMGMRKLFEIGSKRLKNKKFKVGDIVIPFYGKKPQITKSKKKFL